MSKNRTDKRIFGLLKISVAVLLVLCVLLSTAVIAFATDGKWIKSGSRWWYRHTDSTYTRNAWEKIDNKWYHFDKDGWMQTGWLKLNGSWYYLGGANDGVMKTGWVKYNNEWYYLNGSGVMQTGWLKLSGKWYYLADSGAMKTGWLKSGGCWYYLNSGGDMAVGWLKWNNNWYYLASSGIMVTDHVISGDNIYYFGSDGVYIRTGVWYTFANNDRLAEHYQKHGIEMGYASGEDYLLAANAVVNNPNALVKNGSENDTIYFVEATNEIVFVSQYKKIRTYFICSGKAYFDSQ